MSSPNRSIRIGEVLVEQGVLTPQQVLEITQAQRRLGKPFGVLAERMFEVTPQSIERAWAEQYLRFDGLIDLAAEKLDARVLPLVGRRQAWQFEILPLRFEPTGELLVAASKARLARAVAFAADRLAHEVFFRVAEPEALRRLLRLHYPMPEVSADWLDRARHCAGGDRPQEAAPSR